MNDFILICILAITTIFTGYVVYRLKDSLKNNVILQNQLKVQLTVITTLKQENLKLQLDKASKDNLLNNFREAFAKKAKELSEAKSKIETQLDIIQSLRKKERHHKYLLAKKDKQAIKK